MLQRSLGTGLLSDCRTAFRWRLYDLAIQEHRRALGHLATQRFPRRRVQCRVVLKLPVELTAVWLREVFRVDERAQCRAWVFAEDKDLVSRALVEPRLVDGLPSVCHWLIMRDAHMP